ncbi:MAG: S-methyl-5'-thioadenosine phosphorylase [Nocardioidaceae bacterium]
MPEVNRADIAVIGGSGFYTFMSQVVETAVPTPYGDPSAPIVFGGVAGRRVAFLPRHGREHEYPPHRINYRANMWALRSVGVRRVLGVCAAGSLRAELEQGAVVVPDQLVDRTYGREKTFVDEGAMHVGFANPYCPVLRAAVSGAGADIVDGGTMVVVEGPRFSTRAESQWYAGFGCALVNMTGQPEAVLARELAMCYAAIALVTDRDAGVGDTRPVNQVEVLAAFAGSVDRMRELLISVIEGMPEDRARCDCAEPFGAGSGPLTMPWEKQEW